MEVDHAWSTAQQVTLSGTAGLFQHRGNLLSQAFFYRLVADGGEHIVEESREEQLACRGGIQSALLHVEQR